VRRWSWPATSTRAASVGPDAVEIGSTWLTPSAQRTPINTEAKFLLLAYAFESWCVERVQIKTDAENERSRAAILRLGAHFEGVLRAYQPSMARPGKPRDTAMYALTRADWPDVRAHLQGLLAR
jgi:N-acetyltransferase